MARTGRPRGTNNKEFTYSLRMDKETRELLEAYCETMGVTRSEALRTAIEGLKTDKKLRKK